MGEITGRKVLGFMVLAFGLIIGVNLLLAYKAISTFPGLEVGNSYDASQEFNRDKAAQVALDWHARADYHDGVLSVAFTHSDGSPAEVAEMSALVGWATSTKDDFTPTFTYAKGVFSTPAQMARGNWNLRVDALSADGTKFHQRVVLHVGMEKG